MSNPGPQLPAIDRSWQFRTPTRRHHKAQRNVRSNVRSYVRKMKSDVRTTMSRKMSERLPDKLSDIISDRFRQKHLNTFDIYCTWKNVSSGMTMSEEVPSKGEIRCGLTVRQINQKACRIKSENSCQAWQTRCHNVQQVKCERNRVQTKRLDSHRMCNGTCGGRWCATKMRCACHCMPLCMTSVWLVSRLLVGLPFFFLCSTVFFTSQAASK